jgi:hypothetical protein
MKKILCCLLLCFTSRPDWNSGVCAETVTVGQAHHVLLCLDGGQGQPPELPSSASKIPAGLLEDGTSQVTLSCQQRQKPSSSGGDRKDGRKVTITGRSTSRGSQSDD